MSYDPDAVDRYFSDGVAMEWDRLEASLNGRTRYAIHREALGRAMQGLGPGSSVLDVGSGPGRFAIDAAQMGGLVHVTDLSADQVDAARRRIFDAGVSDAISGYGVHDVTDLGAFETDSFDLVMCLGGPVSYVRSSYPKALAELMRVARRRVIVSVMTVWGAMRLAGPLDAADALADPERLIPFDDLLAGKGVIYTNPSPEWHLPLALFTSSGLRAAVEEAGGRIVEMAAANPLVPQTLDAPNLAASESASANLERLEVAASTVPGLLDAGEHLIAIVETTE